MPRPARQGFSVPFPTLSAFTVLAPDADVGLMAPRALVLDDPRGR